MSLLQTTDQIEKNKTGIALPHEKLLQILQEQKIDGIPMDQLAKRIKKGSIPYNLELEKKLFDIVSIHKGIDISNDILTAFAMTAGLSAD